MLKKLKWTRIHTYSSNDISPSQQVVQGDNKQALTIVFATESAVSDEIFFSKSSLKKRALNDDDLCHYKYFKTPKCTDYWSRCTKKL